MTLALDDRTDDSTQLDEGVPAHAPAAAEDPFLAVSLPVLTHLIRYKWLYVAAIAWVFALVTISPGGSKPAATATTAAFQRAGARHAATTATSASPRAGAAGATSASSGSSGSAGFSSFDRTASSDGASFSDPSASLYSGDTAGFTSTDEPATGSGPGSSSPPADQPAASSPSCTTDSSLPAPVATTVVGTVGGVQSTATGTAGQQPPADPTATAASAAGCTGASGTAAPDATHAAAPSSVLFSPEAFAVLLARAMLGPS